MSQIKRYIHAIKHYAKTIERYISPIVKHLYFILAAAKRVVLAGPIVLNVLLAFSLHPFLCAQENVEGSLDKNKAFIGDIITFTVKAQLPKDAQIRASQNFRFNDFDIVNSNVKHIPASENTYQLTFNIAAYKLGRLTINPIKVLYINSKGNDDSFLTPEMGIEVLSTIGNHTTQDIKDIKPLKKLNVRPLYIALITFALASFFVCVVRTLKTIKNQTKEQPQIELDPKIKASNDLENLYKNKNAAGIKPFYYGMSEILRIYVSKKYNFDAMEMTTAEFFGKMKTFLPQNININEFKNYLKTFNLARYADFKPTDIEIENNYAFTKKLLESL